MKANELRIGNYIGLKHCDYEDIPRKVRYTQYPNLVGLKGVSINAIPYNILEPIQLTEEWLLKFGFITDDRKTHFYIKGFAIWICNDLFICNKNGIVLKSIHQLQNLYFALTGKELELTE